MTKHQSVQQARKTTLLTPMLAEMHRRAKLKMKPGEVEGTLTFAVAKSNLLRLNDTDPVRRTLLRCIEGLSESRIHDDSSYYNAVERGQTVTVLLPLPEGYNEGGWRCHAINGTVECLHPNKAHDDACVACQTRKPMLKANFHYLRTMSHSIRSQTKEYLRSIKELDAELTKCERAEVEAAERLASAAEKQVDGHESDTFSKDNDEDVDDDLMMNVELVQAGVWNRVHAATVLSMMKPRKAKSLQLLNSAKSQLSLMTQSAYELAAPHAQKVIRGFLLRASLDRIRQGVLVLAQLAAAVEIQRMVRSTLAVLETTRLRRMKRNNMAIRIQCMFRKWLALSERGRLWSIYMENLRRKAAIKIQSIYRGCICKLKAQKMAEERLRHLEEMKKAKQADEEHDAAVLIQSHARRRISIKHCVNKRVEMGLHERLLMYIERFSVDGDFFMLMKSLNDDYLRFERTITSTIEREEKMAKTFVEKVVRARDADHIEAWDRYCTYKSNDTSHELNAFNSSGKSANQGAAFVSPATIMDKLQQDDQDRRQRVVANDERGWGTKATAITTSKIYAGSRKLHAQHPPPHLKRKSMSAKGPRAVPSKCRVSVSIPTNQAPKTDQYSVLVPEGSVSVPENNASDDRERHHTNRLIRINQLQDRLRGQYLRFDIPNGLDDTVARFIMAVTLRYDFACPRESSLHNGSFAIGSNTKQCLTYAESLIQKLHGQGIVFIRQLLPIDHMTKVLSSFDVSEEFNMLACQLLVVLHQIIGGNYMSRRYLMSECKHFLETQQELSKLSFAMKRRSHHGEFASLLCDFGVCRSDTCDVGDIPGGLWAFSKDDDTMRCNPGYQSMPPSTTRYTAATQHKTWAVAYTKKVLEQNDKIHPAYDQYRHYDLLTNNT